MKRTRVVARRDSTAGGASGVTTTVRYADCQRNHAASTGGHVVDGCREFMANGEEGIPAALTCAACGCHRNFHRRVVLSECPSA